MHSIREDMEVFKDQLRQGSIQRAYGALLAYMLALRARFKKMDAGFAVTGLYQGSMDMTYFAVVPPALKRSGLKIAIVFNYGAFRFEAWLAGSNRSIQQRYWELARARPWGEYRLVAPASGVDSIVECDLAADFDFADLESLSARIEAGTLKFIDRIEGFLAEQGGE